MVKQHGLALLATQCRNPVLLVTSREDLAVRAQLQTERSYNRAHIVILVVDATSVDKLSPGLTRREIALATYVINEGKALLVAINKLDAVPQDRRLQVCAPRLLAAYRAMPCENIPWLGQNNPCCEFRWKPKWRINCSGNFHKSEVLHALVSVQSRGKDVMTSRPPCWTLSQCGIRGFPPPA